MKNLTLILLLFLLPFLAGSKKNKDSLWGLWENPSKDDTLRIISLLSLVQENYLYTNPDSAIILANKALVLARKKSLTRHESLALRKIGKANFFLGKKDKALSFFSKSLKASLALNDFYEISKNYSCLSAYYMSIGSMIKSIDYAKKNLLFAEKANSKFLIGKSLSNLGVMYATIKEDDKAFAFFEKSRAILETTDYKEQSIATLCNIGIFYQEHDKIDESENILKKCLKLAQDRNLSRIELECLSGLAKNQKKFKNLQESIRLFHKALSLSENMKNKALTGITSINIAKIYFGKREIDSCKYYLNKATQIEEIIEDISLSRQIKELQLLILKSEKNYKEALSVYEQLVEINDSILNDESQKKIIQLEFKYKYEKEQAESGKKYEINQLKSKQQKFWIIISFSLVISLISFIAYRRYIISHNDKAVLLKEIELLKQNHLPNSVGGDKKIALNKKNIESKLLNKLNKTDWAVLNIVYINPTIGNKELAAEISLSISGVSSSLNKLYTIFNILNDKRSHKKLDLVIAAARFSNSMVQ